MRRLLTGTVLSQREIAKQCGSNQNTVWRFLKRTNLERPEGAHRGGPRGAPKRLEPDSGRQDLLRDSLQTVLMFGQRWFILNSIDDIGDDNACANGENAKQERDQNHEEEEDLQSGVSQFIVRFYHRLNPA